MGKCNHNYIAKEEEPTMFNENLYREEFMCFAEDECESPQYIPLEDLHDLMCSK